MIEQHKDERGIAELCRLLGVNRSRVYYNKTTTKEIDVVTMNEIRAIYADTPFYGYRKIKVELGKIGYICNVKKVLKLMRMIGIKAIYPGKKTTIPNANHKKHPYLLMGLEITHVNQVFQVDITYIKLRSGFCYLVCLIDLYSRRIVGWAISPFLDTAMCLEAFQNTLKAGIPEIINSDQGCQFTSLQWCEALIANGIQISMDGKGRWVDNKYIERFWRTLKYEAAYLHSFETLSEAKTILGAYIEFYNKKRPHQSLDYKTPNEIYYSCPTLKGVSVISLKKQEIETEGGIVNSQMQPIFVS